jgi:hypothetical protein
MTTTSGRLARLLRTTRLTLMLAIGAALLLGPTAVGTVAAGKAACSVADGQAAIDAGRYQRAIAEFTCVIAAQPTEVEGYRGRVEAQVLLGRYAAALTDYNRVTTTVLPVHPGAVSTIYAGYAARLAANPADVPALTGASFARWWQYDYVGAVQVLGDLLAVRPNDLYGTLFRGSSRLLHNAHASGVADLETAIAKAPASADVRWVVADAYTYGLVDLGRAFAEASLALDLGLDTPRVHAILATALNAFGDVEAAAVHVERAIELVTTELVAAPVLAPGQSMTLGLVPGRVYEIPLPVTAGEVVSIVTSSKDMWDTIAVLLDPAGTPVLGSDDDSAYFAAFDWVAPQTAIYRLRVTSFEAISTGDIKVARG